MKLFILPLSFFLLFTHTSFAQVSDMEIETIVTKLNTKLEKKKGINKIIVADFLDEDANLSGLSLYITDQVSLAFQEVSENISIMDRESAKNLATKNNTSIFNKVLNGVAEIATEELTNNSLSADNDTKNKTINKVVNTTRVIDPASFFGNKTNKQYKGIDAVVTGTLIEFSNYYRLVIKIKSLKRKTKGEIIAATKGNITKTPSIIEMANKDIKHKRIPEDPNYTPVKYKKDLIHFEIINCTQIGQTIECKMLITNTGADIEFRVDTRKTRFMDANGSDEYVAESIRLADKIGPYSVDKTLLKNAPIEATVYFENIPNQVQNMSKLEINCYTKINNRFNTDLRNIPISN